MVVIAREMHAQAVVAHTPHQTVQTSTKGRLGVDGRPMEGEREVKHTRQFKGGNQRSFLNQRTAN